MAVERDARGKFVDHTGRTETRSSYIDELMGEAAPKREYCLAPGCPREAALDRAFCAPHIAEQAAVLPADMIAARIPTSVLRSPHVVPYQVQGDDTRTRPRGQVRLLWALLAGLAAAWLIWAWRTGGIG